MPGTLLIGRRCALLAAGVLAAAVCALYIPFLSNPFVFDDFTHFSGRDFARYAMSPFGFAPRFPASFSVAAVHILFGTVEAHRVVSLVLHAAGACALFALIRRLLPAAPVAALVAALLFAVHPVAVYGAAYLAQRSLVLATLFSLLSATVFVRGVASGRYAYAFGAAALYSLAVLCKEQAIVVAGAIAAAAWLGESRRFALRYAGAFVGACIPAAVFAVLLVKRIIGQTYEPQFTDVAAQVAGASAEAAAVVGTPLLASALTQLALFPRYMALWLWPDTDRMSFDLRVDFAATWTPGVAVASVAAYIAVGVLGAFLVWRRGRSGVVGFGILWIWALYLIEFAVVRFQEPFVLYRSYFWAPGIAIGLAVALARVPPRLLAAGGFAVALGLAWQAHDRLRTFSSGLRLWEDAAAKLPHAAVPGGARTLFELAREYFYAKETDKAAAVLERCMAQYPGVYACVFGRAAMLVELEQHAEALPYLERALAVRPHDGPSRHHIGLALERLGCREAAIVQYEIALEYNFFPARERLKGIRNPGEGLVPPTARAPARTIDCAEAAKRYARAPG